MKAANLHELLQSAETLNTQHRNEARAIHTADYLAEFPDEAFELDENGLIVNEYTARSKYFQVRSGESQVVARFIYPDKKDGILSLPTAKHFDVDPELVKLVSGQQRLSDMNAKVVEISAFSSGTLDYYDDTYDGLDANNILYTTLLRNSLEEGHTLWLMNVDANQKNYLTMMLGEDNIVQIGDEREYIGAPTVPLALNPLEVVTSILKDDSRIGERKKAYLKQTMKGMSEAGLPSELITLLHENGIWTNPEPALALSRLDRHKREVLYGGMLAYAGVRFVPLATGVIPEFSGSAVSFAHIDLITAGTQAYAMEQYFAGDSRTRRVMGAIGAALSLYLPYIYVWSYGGTASPIVNGIALTLAGGATVSEIGKSRKDNKIRNGLEASDLQLSARIEPLEHSLVN